MDQLKLTAKAKEAFASLLGSQFDVILEKYPKLAEEISLKAAQIQAVKKLRRMRAAMKQGKLFEQNREGNVSETVKSSSKQGGIFGRSGIFSLLAKNIFKKTFAPSASLEKDNTGVETPTSLNSASTPTPQDSKAKSLKEADLIKETVEPTLIKFDGFTDTGKKELEDFLPPLFKDIFKKIFEENKDLFAPQTEQEEQYSEGGLIGTLLDYLPLLGGRRGAARRRARRMRRSRTARARNTPTPTKPTPAKPSTPSTPAKPTPAKPIPAKPSTPSTPTKPTPAKPIPAKPPITSSKPGLTGASKAAEKGAAKGALKAAEKGAAKGALKSTAKGLGKRVPILGTVLTLGFLGEELYGISEQEKTGEITKEEASKAKGGAYGSAAGGTIGAAGGAAAGAAIGALFGGVGAVPGAIIGGILGGLGGDMLGRTTGEYLGSGNTEETKNTANPQDQISPSTPPNQPTDIKPIDVENPIIKLEEPKLQPSPQPKVIPAADQATDTLANLKIPEPIDNSQVLTDISSNTKTTNNSIQALSNAVFKLAQVFDKNGKTGSNNIIVNGQQQQQTPSASQVAASNVDPIRRIRAQFAV